MNTANLQLEGLLVAVSQLLETLRRKELLTQQEIEAALDAAEDATVRDAETRNISCAQAEGMRFPIRFLRVATSLAEGRSATFSDLTTFIGQTKERG